jgi:hypothetical protein
MSAFPFGSGRLSSLTQYGHIARGATARHLSDEFFPGLLPGTLVRGLQPVELRCDLRKAKGGYLAECREGQRVEHPARLKPAGSQ